MSIVSTVCIIESGSKSSAQELPRTLYWKWAALTALLLVEGIVFTIRFDSAAIEEIDAAWAGVLGQAWLVGRFGISFIAALIVFGGGRVARSLALLTTPIAADKPPLLALGIHALALWALYAFTAVVFDGGFAATFESLLWLCAWFTSGMLALAGWAAAMFPISFWWAAATRARGFLVLGVSLAIAAIVAGQLAAFFWPLLAGPTIACVEAILRLFYSDVVVIPEEFSINVHSFTVIIDTACSGFEGIGLIGVFVGGFLWSFRDRLLFPQAFILLPLGMAVIWTSNVLRLAALVALGASYSETVAAGGFHSQAGWLAFNVVALGVVYFAWNTSVFHSAPAIDTEGGPEANYQYAAGPYLLPLVMLLAVMMITNAFSAPGFDWFYPMRVAATLTVIACYWSVYRARGYLAWNWSWAPILIGAAVFCIWRALEPLSGIIPTATTQQAEALASLSPAAALSWLVFRCVGSIVAVPLAEELCFRGFLPRQLVSDDFESVPLGRFTWFSFVVSSVLFGALHGRWLAGTIAGMLFAAALYRRGRMMDAIVAHATANALVTIYVLTTADWAAWS